MEKIKIGWSSLVRHIKEDYTKLQNDGCGYVVKDSLKIVIKHKEKHPLCIRV